MPKAYAFTANGGPEVEAFVDLPEQRPGPGELVIAVHAAGVNPVDWKRRNGFPGPAGAPTELPAVFGNEVAGVVTGMGPDVSGFAVGDAVFGNPLTGGYAEQALLPDGVTAAKPDAVSFTDAATLPVAAATAYDAITQLALPAGATLLVTGVGGGVGVAAAQIAREFGLRVVGTASPAKREFVESLGVTHVAAGNGVAGRVRAAAPDGVDAVFDLVGGADLEAVADLVDDRSKLISAGDRQTVARLGGAPVQRARTSAVLASVAELVERGALSPFVTQTFPFSQAAAALRAVEDGHARGKVVIEIG
jgi:NADPH:quinone reductase-like Zn-dependent oxidoreductase